MREGEINRRYDILDGVRYFMTNPTRLHQVILMAITDILRAYAKADKTGTAYIAPCDILIRRFPLKTRQPDVLFMSNERVAANPPESDPSPLSPAPELVVEIISPSDSMGVFAAKLADYQRVGVQECWVVDPHDRSVEVLEITDEDIQTLGEYPAGSAFSSKVFPALQVNVTDIFPVSGARPA
jgi:Uma2 family endonuclease